MREDLFLKSGTAKRLYEAVRGLPIVDYHCHLSPKEILEDKVFTDIAQVWLSGDHYKWRLMRACGVPERLITGDAPAREKFRAYADCIETAAGNPLYVCRTWSFQCSSASRMRSRRRRPTASSTARTITSGRTRSRRES